MPTIVAPFAGLRYNPRVVGDLGTIMTPPYDVISQAERAAYMDQSPYSMMGSLNLSGFVAVQSGPDI